MTVKVPVLLCVSLASAALFSSCGTTAQQSRFQMAFLPTVPRPLVAPPELDEPPQLNSYLAEVPALVNAAPQLPPFTRATALMKSAEQRFQRGRKLYQAHDAENARRQFDAAIDLMLQASENKPFDRLEFQHRFEQMVDAIHRYDLTGMGAAAT